MKRMTLTSLILFIGLSVPALSHKDEHPEHIVDGVQITNVWARAGKPNSAAFMKLFNTSGEMRKIVGAKTDITEHVELHDHVQEGDVMKMRKVDAIDIPVGQVVELKPGGKHVMFFGLKEALKEGQHFKLSLIFDNGSKAELQVPVKAMRYKGECPCPKSKEESPCPKITKECPCPKSEKQTSLENELEEMGK